MKRLIRKATGHSLVIVDIQKDFAMYFDQNYLNKVDSIISGNWDRIIVVVDDNDGSPEIPSFIKSVATDILYKSYGGIDQEYIEELIESDEIEIVSEDEIYKWDDRMIVPGNQHENFLVPEDMVAVFTELQEVTIIGGADEECLDDVESALKCLNVNVKRNSSGIYHASNKHDDEEWIYDVDWVSV